MIVEQSTAGELGFDPTSGSFVANPYPTYARLRACPRLVWWEQGRLWLASRYEHVNALLRDRRLGRVFVPQQPADELEPWNALKRHSMLELEPPDHTRLRRLVSREFTPRRVERLRRRVVELADQLLDPLLGCDDVDLVSQFAEPLPVQVIAELLGVPSEDRHLLRPWSNTIVSLVELVPEPGAADRAAAAAAEFAHYLRRLIARRRYAPGEDLFSALVRKSVQEAGLTEDELVATAVLLLNAGHEASVNVLGNGVVALLTNPKEHYRLRMDVDLVPTAVEEIIRIDSPLSLFTRTVLEDLRVGEQELRAGERVGLLLGAANRDPAAFSDADVLDIGRYPNPHVGFGAGIHYCLGAPLARLELQVMLERLFLRSSRLTLAAEPVPRTTYQFRGYQNVVVAL